MIDKRLYEHKMRNAEHFMQHTKIINKLENTLLKVPATIGALAELEPCQLFDNRFNMQEVNILNEALSKYNLHLSKVVGPDSFFDPSKLEEPKEEMGPDPDIEYTV